MKIPTTFTKAMRRAETRIGEPLEDALRRWSHAISQAQAASILGVRSTAVRCWAQYFGIPWSRHAPRPRETSQIFYVGKKVSEWAPIVADASERGAKKAAERYGVPVGAVEAMLCGREEPVG